MVQKTIRFLMMTLTQKYSVEFSRNSQKISRFLVLKTVLKCARCILYIRTSLRTLQTAIYGNSYLIKNLFRLPKKNLGSFMRVSTFLRPGPSRRGVAKVVTRGPGAFRGPEERHIFLIFSLFSVFLKERL